MERSKRNPLTEYARKFVHVKARQLVGKYGFTRDDYEDLCQEMILDLLIRLPKFDPSKASLNTFIDRIVNRKAANLIRYQRQAKRDYRRQAWAPRHVTSKISQPPQDAGGISQDDFDFRFGKYTPPATRRQDLCIDVASILAALPPDLQPLAKLLMTHSVAEAARELRVARSTLCEGPLARLRGIFAEETLEKYF